MAVPAVGMNDALLLMSILYLSIDLVGDWDEFKGCHQPIHQWILVSYGLVVLSRLVYISGAMLSRISAGAFLLDLREKDSNVQALMKLTWFAILPAFTAWSVVGTKWIWDVVQFTPQCAPGGAHFWFLAIWQSLSYFWICVHGGLGGVAWFLEHRLRRAERQLRQLESPDVIARWGHVSQLGRFDNMPDLAGGSGLGLSPDTIMSLSGASIAAVCFADDCECPICLNAIKTGDQMRELAGCSHRFHRSCIDLWLVRRADCPLCKGKVLPSTVAGPVSISV